MQQTTETEKHIFVGDTAEDDYPCEKCENVELLLISIKQSDPDLVDSFSVDPQTFVSQLVSVFCEELWLLQWSML